jgi:iron(III) transport system substrate-binding protein
MKGKIRSALLNTMSVAAVIVVLGNAACSRGNDVSSHVVVYASIDRAIAEPILKRFEQQTSIEVRAVYDTEANKTTGLVNRLIAESARPQADVFWSGEIGQTVLLSRAGALAAYVAPESMSRIDRFNSSDNIWHAFAARARVLLVNSKLVPDTAAPVSVEALAQPEWKGRIAIADPNFGTTGSHLAALLVMWGEERFGHWLVGLRENGVRIMPGNAQVRDAVASGVVAAGLTDSDDAVDAVKRGAPVWISLLRQSEEFGVVMIPNTVALVHGAPNPDAGKRLVDHLLSKDVESKLVMLDSVFYPTRGDTGTDATRKLMEESVPANYEPLADARLRMLNMVEAEWFRQGSRLP